MNPTSFIQPNWPAPANVHAFTTLRKSGVSQPPHNRLDRSHLISLLHLPTEPIWLHQVHGATVLPALPENREKEADASFSHQSQQICVIQTADCLPILLCDKKGTQVAAIHAGWRGLTKNIIAETLKALQTNASELLAWIGPGISQRHYEVNADVRDIFINQNNELAAAFIPSPQQRWLADLYAIATSQLHQLGVVDVYGGDLCTYGDKENFFSYRRDGAGTGRIVSLIWMS
jgi:YfiH family protein